MQRLRFAALVFLCCDNTFAQTSQSSAANTEQHATQFSEHLIADGYSYAFGLVAVDIDRDGDLDLTSQDVRGKPSMSFLYWFENDGNGKFQRHPIWKDEPGWFERHSAGDITGDGLKDIAIVNNRDGQIVWFANNDRPADGVWKRYVITTKCPRAYDVVLVDIDGDTDLDAAAAGYAGNDFTWYENPGRDGWDSEWTRRIVGEKMPEARMIRTGDFNKDGRIDLLCACVGVEDVSPDVTDVAVHGSSVVWYENPGKRETQLWKKHVIDEQSRAQIHGQPHDFDGDGDLDVVMALGMRSKLINDDRHHVAWYENVGKTGLGKQWNKHKIGDLPFAFEAHASDLDGDGDVDVAATAWAKGDQLVWFENSGDPRKRWTKHILKEKWYAANQLFIADFNGDKRPDIAATSDNGSRYATGALDLRWWRNEGSNSK